MVQYILPYLAPKMVPKLVESFRKDYQLQRKDYCTTQCTCIHCGRCLACVGELCLWTRGLQGKFEVFELSEGALREAVSFYASRDSSHSDWKHKYVATMMQNSLSLYLSLSISLSLSLSL